MPAPPLFERQFTDHQAICLVDRVLSELGLSIIEQKESLDFLASRITVEDNNGIRVSGSGKGLHHQIGARAESIEHYLTETCLAETVDCQLICNLVHQDVFRRDGIIQTLATFTNSETPVIPMDPYLDNHSPEVKIPHILLNPADDWAETSDANEYLARYSTNTGTAFGLSEAVLHALMDCIERHTQSELFLNIIGQGNNRKFSFLKSHEISDWPLINKLDIPPFHIFARATNGGAWFFLIAEAFPRMRLCEFGAGCSLSAHHAMERAITEYAQCIGLADGVETDEERTGSLMSLKPLETFRFCYETVCNF